MWGQTKEQAQAKADKCLGKIKYKGFKTRVWENLGWCWNVHNSGFQIFESGDDRYSILLNGHDSNIPVARSGSDPNKLLEEQAELAKKYVESITQKVESLTRLEEK